MAGRGGFGGGPAPAATLIDHYERTGARIVYWDGIAHTAAADPAVGATAAERMRTEGNGLRARFGADYRSVGTGFHHGDLGTAYAPAPRPDLVDAIFGAIDPAAWFVDRGDEIPAAAPGRRHRLCSGSSAGCTTRRETKKHFSGWNRCATRSTYWSTSARRHRCTGCPNPTRAEPATRGRLHTLAV